MNAYDNAGGAGALKYVAFEKPSSDYGNAGTVYSAATLLSANASAVSRSDLVRLASSTDGDS